jgi:hypothetical protein
MWFQIVSPIVAIASFALSLFAISFSYKNGLKIKKQDILMELMNQYNKQEMGNAIRKLREFKDNCKNKSSDIETEFGNIWQENNYELDNMRRVVSRYFLEVTILWKNNFVDMNSINYPAAELRGMKDLLTFLLK